VAHSIVTAYLATGEAKQEKANLDQSGSCAKDGAWELRSPTMTTTLYRNLGDGGQDVTEAANWPRFERVAAPTLQ
jgi:hypothetical protein